MISCCKPVAPDGDSASTVPGWFDVCTGSGVDAKGPLFNVTKRGKITYYMEGDGVISSLVTKEEADGDLLIHFAGLTGGTSKHAT